MNVLKGLLGSKKFWTAIGTLVTLVLSLIGLDVSPDVHTALVTAITALGGVLIAAFGAQDAGKEKAKILVEASNKATDPTKE